MMRCSKRSESGAAAAALPRKFRLALATLALGGLTTRNAGVYAQVGVNGETACSLRDRINSENCGGVTSREIADRLFSRQDAPNTTFTPSPSSCTCNTPFFNIWSVCVLFESRWSTLPALDSDLKKRCQDANVLFRPEVDGQTLGQVEIPQWARVREPHDDKTFDVVGIVRAAETTRWTLLQILAPVISAIGLILLLSLAYFFCFKQRPDPSRLFRRAKRLSVFLRPSRVRSEDPQGGWVIDREEQQRAGGGGGNDVLHITPFPETAAPTHTKGASADSGYIPQPKAAGAGEGLHVQQTVFQPNRPVHHISLSTDDSSKEGTGTTGSDGMETPPAQLQSKWSDSEHHSQQQQCQRRGSPVPWITGGEKTKGGGLIPRLFKNPFRAKPVRVKPAAPRAGFMLDDYDRNTESMFSKSKAPSPLNGQSDDGRWSTASSVDFASLNGHRDGDVEQMERATLISVEERQMNDVFLISKTGRDFTISDRATVTTRESGTVNLEINVASPTASSMSWRNSNNNAPPPVPALPAPPLPPPPRRPPPTSAPSQAPTYPLANIPDTLPVPTLKPNRLRSDSDTSIGSSSTKTLRWEPVTVNQTTGPAARPNLLHPPLRTVYESDKYPSSESLKKQLQQQQQHQRSQSHDTSATSSGFAGLWTADGPLLPPQLPHPHRRGLSEDDEASFYLTTPESAANVAHYFQHGPTGQRVPGPPPLPAGVMHLRKGSTESLVRSSRKSDPINLIPASVRSAGYTPYAM